MKQLLKNAKVYTVNLNRDWAEAIVIEDDKILFVGSNEDAAAFCDDSTAVTDLEGKLVLPAYRTHQNSHREPHRTRRKVEYMRIYIKATGCKMSLKNADLVVYDNSIIINNRHTEIELIFKDIQIQSKSPIHKNYICFDDEGKEVNIYCRM